MRIVKYIIYCILITLALFSAEASANMLGDVNNDGRITTADSLLALRMAAGSVAPDLERADVNADGRVNSLDALMILTMAEKTQVCVNAPEVVSGAFEVTIDVHNVADLDSGQFDLSFNSSAVNVTAVRDGNIDGKQVPVDSWQFMDAGRIRVLFNHLPGLDGVSGSGHVAKIDFETTGSEGDTSVLDISGGVLTNVSAPHVHEIPAIWIDDEVRIGEPTPTANPVRNVDTGEIFSSIQDAIDDPDTLDGHAIVVGDGVYRENVKVTKSLTILSENGSANCIIQAAIRYDYVVEITADYANISGFAVKGSRFVKAGIYLNSGYCNVSNNNCSNNYIGIRLDGSDNNIVSSNDCSNNCCDGIRLNSSSNNHVSSNNCSNNGWYGIRLSGSSNNIVSSNDCSDNWVGIRRSGSCNNLVYLNNFINNKDNTNSRAYTTIWNSTSRINYTYEGRNYTNYLGNYWDDYTGSDSDNDGIGDSPHRIDSDNDHCPLIAPFENYSVPTENLIIVDVNAPEVISGSFNATIDIHRVADLDSGQFDMRFDSRIVNVTGVNAGNIGGTTVPIIDWRFIDVNTIRVTFKPDGAGGVGGNGYVARIGFAMLGPRGCVSVLDILNGKLVDAGGEEIPAVWFDDEVAIPAPVTVNAPPVVTDRFNITIDVENVTDLDSGQFELSFDPGVVIVEDVEAGSICGTTISIVGWSFMDVGTIKALFNLPGLKGVSGSGYVARINFELTGSQGDTSALDISNGLLVNNNADKMPAIWIDDGVTIGEHIPVNRVHNINTGEEFSFIQAAIDDPDTLDGHIIEVKDGVYRETVMVTKSLTIRSLNGSANCVIQDAGADHVVEITADHVSISGFTVTGRRVLGVASGGEGIHLNASYCNVSGNTCSNNSIGISLRESSNNSISSNNCPNNGWAGICLGGSNNNSISNNNCSNNERVGICLDGSNNNSISNNNCSNNMYERTFIDGYGIRLTSSSNNSISNNDCSNSYNGIYLSESCNNSISNNTCPNNRDDGIDIYDSSNNKLTGNTMFESGIFIRSDSLSNYTHEIDESNTVNGKPVHYWLDIESGRIPDGGGQVILVNCKGILVENQELTNASVGVEVAFSSNITIRNNTCSNNRHGGICLSGSSNSSISSNTCSNNQDDGIRLLYSSNNSISNNDCSNNQDDGICLGHSSNSRLTGNILVENGIVIWGDYTHEIDESNTVNGKPVYYRKDIECGRIPDGAGQVILVNCKGVLVEDQELNNASVGVEVAFSSNITIRNNTCSNNRHGGICLTGSNNSSISSNTCSNNQDDGICLGGSGNNSISSNNCSNNWCGISLCGSYNNDISNNNFSNNWAGIYPVGSCNNVIYLNNFINNAVYTGGIGFSTSTNIWNSISKINYTYEGRTFTNYLGNYWSNYKGSDSDNDGIGDSPYRIDHDRDNYPLVMPIENYSVGTANISEQKKV